jgi:hypothetical protein
MRQCYCHCQCESFRCSQVPAATGLLGKPISGQERWPRCLKNRQQNGVNCILGGKTAAAGVSPSSLS